MWIAVIVVVGIIYAIRRAKYDAKEYARRAEQDAISSSMTSFYKKTTPNYDVRQEIDMRVHQNKYDGRREKIVKDFMNDDDPVWDKFTLAIFDPAACIIAARHGKVYSCRIDTPSDELVGPRSLELTERFVLKIEEELQKNGVRTFIIGNYPGGENYVPVREYVKEHGFGSKKERWLKYTFANLDSKYYKQVNG